jgi:transcriptional regulator with PAS, ATPase and Fis domain
VKGAFTGAVRGRAGLFEVANGGTLFLDEIGEMSAAMQTKLLRVFESGEVRPVGSESMRKVDVRVIGATHRDLKELVADGSFREDLLFRLDVVSLRVPPLRERPDDIPRLAQHFLRKHAEGREVTLSPQASDVLSAFSWPGNVRQLENELRRALVFCDGAVLPEHLSEEVRSSDARGAASHFDLKARVDELTRKLVQEALEETNDNQTKAAELLGISRFGLSKMLRRLELDAAPQTLPEPGPRVSRVPRRHARPDAPSRAKRSKPARRDG